MAKLVGMPIGKNRPNWKAMYASAEDSVFSLGIANIKATADVIGPWFVVRALTDYLCDWLEGAATHEHEPGCECKKLVPELAKLEDDLNDILEEKDLASLKKKE